MYIWVDIHVIYHIQKSDHKNLVSVFCYPKKTKKFRDLGKKKKNSQVFRKSQFFPKLPDSDPSINISDNQILFVQRWISYKYTTFIWKIFFISPTLIDCKWKRTSFLDQHLVKIFVPIPTLCEFCTHSNLVTTLITLSQHCENFCTHTNLVRISLKTRLFSNFLGTLLPTKEKYFFFLIGLSFPIQPTKLINK